MNINKDKHIQLDKTSFFTEYAQSVLSEFWWKQLSMLCLVSSMASIIQNLMLLYNDINDGHFFSSLLYFLTGSNCSIFSRRKQISTCFSKSHHHRVIYRVRRSILALLIFVIVWLFLQHFCLEQLQFITIRIVHQRCKNF